MKTLIIMTTLKFNCIQDSLCSKFEKAFSTVFDEVYTKKAEVRNIVCNTQTQFCSKSYL